MLHVRARGIDVPMAIAMLSGASFIALNSIFSSANLEQHRQEEQHRHALHASDTADKPLTQESSSPSVQIQSVQPAQEIHGPFYGFHFGGSPPKQQQSVQTSEGSSPSVQIQSVQPAKEIRGPFYGFHYGGSTPKQQQSVQPSEETDGSPQLDTFAIA